MIEERAESEPETIMTKSDYAVRGVVPDEVLQPGERCGIGDAGWPPLTIVRDSDGRYFAERLTRRQELSPREAAAWIAADAADEAAH